MNFKFLDYKNIEDLLLNTLRSNNISVDDWDYILISQDLTLLNQFRTLNIDETHDYTSPYEVRTENYQLNRLLNGCYDNMWYKIVYNNRETIVGIAYHG